jgi:hypothetical protein
MSARTVTVLASVACVLVACAQRAPEVRKPTPAERPRAARGMPLSLPAPTAAKMLERERFELRSLERVAGGVTRVFRALAHFPGRDVDLRIKWKLLPSGGDGWDNVARKEVAAFAIQRWFLDPEDWVVPPTTIRCVSEEEHDRLFDADPIVEGTHCVLGMAAAWLEDVQNPDVILDDERFEADRIYAHHRTDMNLLAYLVDHRDGRTANFLVPKPDDGRIYLIDNGISFGGLVWNYFRPNWNVIRVPKLQREAVDRLRRITAADVDALLVLVQLEADAQGVLQPAARESVWDASDGARLRPRRAQFGLKAKEAAGVAERVQRLLARVDTGEIGLF